MSIRSCIRSEYMLELSAECNGCPEYEKDGIWTESPGPDLRANTERSFAGTLEKKGWGTVRLPGGGTMLLCPDCMDKEKERVGMEKSADAQEFRRVGAGHFQVA